MQREKTALDTKLIRVTSEGNTSEVPLASGRTLVGRQDHCQIRIPKSDVSREHCEFVAEEDTGLSVKDLGSSNGTYVNRKRVQVAVLNAGDLVSVGGLVFVVHLDGHPQQIDASLCYEDGLPEPEPKEKPPSPPKTAPATASAEQATRPSGLLDEEFGELGGDPADSSVLEFDFDLDDDDLDKQPEL